MDRTLEFWINRMRSADLPSRLLTGWTVRRALWLALIVSVGAAGLCYSRLSRSHRLGARRAGPQQIIVCIDPGHPSQFYSGRAVRNGTTEMEINWEVALKLQSLLEKDKRIKVVKTREVKDQVMQNRERALVGNEANASLVVHLHCDTGPNHGFTVYFPNREGTVEGNTGPPEDVRRSSRQAADALHSAMAEALDGDLKDRGVKGESSTRVGRMDGALTTSVFSEAPTVTVEMVFLSNKSDVRFIKSKKGQQKMAAAIAQGIKDYLQRELKAPEPKVHGIGCIVSIGVWTKLYS